MKLTVTVLLLSMLAGAQTKQPAESTTDKQPDYEQTRKWIIKKMGQAGYKHVDTFFRSTEIGSYDAISMDDCTLSFTRTEETIASSDAPVNAGSDKTEKQVVVVPLNKVSGVRFSHLVSPEMGWNEWNLMIETTSNAVSYRESETQRGVVGEKLAPGQLGSDASIHFGTSPETDEDSVNRMKKALDNAVSLCKEMNRKELF